MADRVFRSAPLGIATTSSRTPARSSADSAAEALAPTALLGEAVNSTTVPTEPGSRSSSSSAARTSPSQVAEVPSGAMPARPASMGASDDVGPVCTEAPPPVLTTPRVATGPAPGINGSSPALASCTVALPSAAALSMTTTTSLRTPPATSRTPVVATASPPELSSSVSTPAPTTDPWTCTSSPVASMRSTTTEVPASSWARAAPASVTTKPPTAMRSRVAHSDHHSRWPLLCGRTVLRGRIDRRVEEALTGGPPPCAPARRARTPRRPGGCPGRRASPRTSGGHRSASADRGSGRARPHRRRSRTGRCPAA